MNRISCEINFKIVERPKEPLTKMGLTQVDGSLHISSKGKVIFSEDSICLAEFAAKLSNWLNNGYPHCPFLYESMDYEDPYIIRAEVINSDIILSSPWMVEGISSPLTFNLNDLD
ncbi:hypothetical protein [Vibrio neptunius]|uniref:DUF7878 domain-containing protein n=1 Tax=Vibrio neptunius TaxID=170651 RepID=UPI003CE58762